jgi:hypothetical protein
MAKVTGMIVTLTALLAAFAGLIDVFGRVVSGTEPVTCALGFKAGVSLPWCGPRRKSYNLTAIAKASSSGNDSLKTSTACEDPPDGWHFVPDTFQGIPSKGSAAGPEGGFGDRPGGKPDVKPERLCFSVWADTHDARVTRSFEGSGSVIIERN